MFKKILAGLVLALISFSAQAQVSSVIRGELNQGTANYQTIQVDSGGRLLSVSGGLTHTSAAVSVLVTNTVVLAANTSRRFLSIENQDAANAIWIRCDGVAATADNNGYKILAGQTWMPSGVPIGACNGISTVGTVLTNVISGQ